MKSFRKTLAPFTLGLLSTLSVAHATSVLLADPGNDCPADYSKITNWAHCRAAIKLVERDPSSNDDLAYGMSYNGAESAADWPKGCYFCEDAAGCEDGTWFNNHTSGSANGGARPYCVHQEDGFQTGLTLFVGDSDVDFWDSSPHFEGSYNVGFGGYTTVEVLAEVGDILSVFQPSRIVMVVGENDMVDDNDASQITLDAFGRLSQIIAAQTEAGARVLMLGTKPEPGTTELHAEYEKYDAMVLALVDQMADAVETSPPPLAFVNVYKGFTDLGNPSSLYQSDDLHMSAEGYALWNTWTTQALASDTCRVWLMDQCVNPPIAPGCVISTCEDLPTTCAMLDSMLADDGCSKGLCTDADKVQLKAFAVIMVPNVANCPALNSAATEAPTPPVVSDAPTETPASGANAASLAVNAALCALAGASAMLLA